MTKTIKIDLPTNNNFGKCFDVGYRNPADYEPPDWHEEEWYQDWYYEEWYEEEEGSFEDDD